MYLNKLHDNRVIEVDDSCEMPDLQLLEFLVVQPLPLVILFEVVPVILAIGAACRGIRIKIQRLTSYGEVLEDAHAQIMITKRG